MSDNPFRQLPAVNDVLAATDVKALAREHAHDLIVEAVRSELRDLREQIRQGSSLDGQCSIELVAARVAQRLGHEFRPKLRAVINATGIVLHTNLGRSPVAEEAAPGGV